MASKDKQEPKIFSLHRLKFNELYEDALSYIKNTYRTIGQQFTTASPFGQLLQVTIHLGRMIFYYIEDSITGLNIRTAYRPDQVKGLARLAGHSGARAISARGAISISFVDNGDMQLKGGVCYIPNKTEIVSLLNGMTYTIFFGASAGRITMQAGNYLDANIIQGQVKMQYVTGTGEPLQSYNFTQRNYGEVDQFYTNVYVNGELWENVDSIQDLGFNQKGCVVKTGINGGLDIYFGNKDMGAIPPKGSKIVCEYIVTDGYGANISKEEANSSKFWKIQGNGMLADGSEIPLDKNFTIKCETDVIFGTNSEDTAMTQIIAPHVSRSFVLANETNYKYFFKRMNMFSNIQVIRGSYNVNGTSMMQLAYEQACDNLKEAQQKYNEVVDSYGAGSDEAKVAVQELEKRQHIRQYAQQKMSDNTFQDNTIYLFLVPDIKKRLSSNANYFNCDESLFYLSEVEQENIINLINNSGQRIMTIENKIIQPKVARFSINVHAKIWSTYDEQSIYTQGLQKLSDYFVNYSRKDIIPLSDIVSIFENDVEGIDSVRVSFDADTNNQNIYGQGKYGIDEFGDIMLSRTITDSNGQYQVIRDILPLVRGGFVSKDGVEYSSHQSKDALSAFNLTIIGRTTNTKINLNDYTPLT